MAKRKAPSCADNTVSTTEDSPLCPHCGNKGRLPDFVLDSQLPIEDCVTWKTICMQCNKEWVVTIRLKMLVTYENSLIREFTVSEVKKYLLDWCCDATDRENDILEFPTSIFMGTKFHTDFIEYRNSNWSGGTPDQFIEFVHNYANAMQE